MATTNFLVFNPTKANQESDSTYNADAQRTGGAAVDAIFDSALANKVFYQASTMNTALAEMLVGKGFSSSDANLAALVTVLSNLLTTADIPAPLLSAVYAPTYTFNAAAAAALEMELTGNLTLSVSGLAPGMIRTFAFQQDSVGGRTVTWPSNFYNPGPGAPDPTPNAVSLQAFFVLADSIARPFTAMTVSAD